MDNYAQLKDAVLGAQQQGSPQSPLGNFPELAKLYASSFQLPLSNAATQAQGFQTGVTVANQKAGEAEAKANQLDALKAQYQAIQDQSDPSKYQRVPKQDGGFGFFDPSGKEISAFDYARVTGKDPTEVLKGSQNPIDTQFSQDYKQLNQYIQDKQNASNDPKARSRAQAVETQVRKLYNIKLHQQDPNEVINAFKAAYPTVFGGQPAGRQHVSTLLPTNETLKNSTSLGGGGL